MKNSIFFIFLFLGMVSSATYAEGTAQLRKAIQEKSAIQIYDRSDDKGPLRKFATYEADSNERLYFTIADYQKETVMYGFQMTSPTDTVYVRIKDKSGIIVSMARLIPDKGTGFISTYAQAILGPNHSPERIQAGGYVPFIFKPAYNGDFYMEFNPGDPDVIPADDSLKRKHIFEFFDLSIVHEQNHSRIEGRVWSRAWDFNTQSEENIFTADLYIYSDDGIVTKVNFNGMKPFGFVVSSNQTGTTNSGDPFHNRQSVDGNQTYPQYKIFLTYPDPFVFPPGEKGVLLHGTQIHCNDSSYCFSFRTTSSGTLELLLEFNSVPGFQPGTEDVLLATNVTGSGDVCVPWDGLTGLGEKVGAGIPIMTIASFTKGLTHLPLYDVEGHPNGYIVEMIVPEKKILKLFWDDSAIIGGSSQLNGSFPDTLTATGCHGWSLKAGDAVRARTPLNAPGFGNNRTVNTWWYATLQTDTLYPVLPVLPRVLISSDHQVKEDTAMLCVKSQIQLSAALAASGGHVQYSWSSERAAVQSTTSSLILSGLHQDTPVSVTVTNPSTHCTAEDAYYILVRDINVPNLFSPNGDSKNDCFEILNLFPDTKIEVFNRWGDQVYKSLNYKNDWNADGVSDGVFYYKVESGDNCGSFLGWVQITR